MYIPLFHQIVKNKKAEHHKIFITWGCRDELRKTRKETNNEKKKKKKKKKKRNRKKGRGKKKRNAEYHW
jgi:hypothetical protein